MTLRKESMYLTFSRVLTVFLLLTLAAAQSNPAQSKPAAKPAAEPSSVPKPYLPSEETVNAFMQQNFAYDSSLSWKINDIKPSKAQGLAEVYVTINSPQGAQGVTLFVTPDGKHALVGELMPFGAKPFAAARQALEKGASGPARGPANSPVTIVEFSDLQCPHCKEAQPVIEKLISDNPNARFVFQNFPLPSHNWAAKAANYGDCVGRASNDAFWKFVQKTYEAQEQITASNADEKLTAIANDSGVKGADIAACAGKPETTARVEHSIDLGKSVDVTGTPTVFINGFKVRNLGMPPDQLKALVEFEAKQAK
ncbi:MAG TPA: thioredoxin domain-containing protein, partial [Terriglobales bacterium]|nr:thioredoxin domain-containing protein [Terriglobales bacterium]